MPNFDSKRYVVALLATVAVAFMLVIINALVIDKDAVIRCDARDLRADNFIVGCSAYFGEYDHAALAFGLEPRASANLAAAQVLFLGNSRLMHAFSTQATGDAFRRLGVTYYLLGFGSNERSRFAAAVLRRQNLRPRAVIINADPFFVDATNPEYEPIIAGRTEALLPAVFRKYAQRWLHEFCVNPQRMFPSSTCNLPASYRSADDGRWQLPKSDNLRDRVPVASNPNLSVEQSGKFIAVARQFVQLLDIPSRCIILTSVPSDLETENAARKVASALDFTFIAPKVDGLATIDRSHLAPESAEAWSEIMLRDAAATIRSCTQNP
jgi:hypothetical protein